MLSTPPPHGHDISSSRRGNSASSSPSYLQRTSLRPQPSMAAAVTPVPETSQVIGPSDHDRRKERERIELVEMILESIANVPMAVERIHTNEKLRSALRERMGDDNHLLHRFFDDADENTASHTSMEPTDERLSSDSLLRLSGQGSVDGRRSANDEESESDSSSGFGFEYEHDLEEAVNQLCMSDDVLAAMDKRLSVPIRIGDDAAEVSSIPTSNSPRSSINLGVSPGASSQDGEPVSALWPRQPHQFAFTQEEEGTVRGEDEVYSELVSSMCEDESVQDDEGDDFEDSEKVFDMDDDSGGLGDEIPHYHRAPVSGGFIAGALVDSYRSGFRASDEDSGLENDGDDGDDNEDDDASDYGTDREYDVFDLRIIREKYRTGFEPSQDWNPRVGSLIGGRYKVMMAIGEAVFSRTYKCVDTANNQIVCLKIIKNNKEYFDQGVDEIRVLEYIARHCNVDEKHLVRLLDYFYFREHLIIVTELLRDNLYEFSKLLLHRGIINYFSIPRLKKIAIEVLEALQFLHSLELVHCDLKPENILISDFNECKIKVIDFGSACFVTDELTSYVQSRSYRAPEVILGLEYDQKIDVWSLGCVLAELFTGEVLFKNESEQTLLARIIATIGPVPSDLLNEREELLTQFRSNSFFTLDETGNGVLASSLRLPSLEEVVLTVDQQFVSFLRALLTIDPHARVSAAQALKHPWLASGVFSPQEII